MTAEGQEIDTGKQRTSTAKVLYQINEATSFKQELVPLFMLPLGAGDVTIQNKEGHNCVFCHDGGGASPAGIDFHPNTIYDQLVNHDIAADGINGSTCATQSTLGLKRIVPGDLTKSLWFMKVSGTDGAGGSSPPCGTQMPLNQPHNYWTTSDQDAWDACPNGNNDCRTALNCVSTDLDCKLNARLVRKASVWIKAGALNN